MFWRSFFLWNNNSNLEYGSDDGRVGIHRGSQSYTSQSMNYWFYYFETLLGEWIQILCRIYSFLLKHVLQNFDVEVEMTSEHTPFGLHEIVYFLPTIECIHFIHEDYSFRRHWESLSAIDTSDGPTFCSKTQTLMEHLLLIGRNEMSDDPECEVKAHKWWNFVFRSRILISATLVKQVSLFQNTKKGKKCVYEGFLFPCWYELEIIPSTYCDIFIVAQFRAKYFYRDLYIEKKFDVDLGYFLGVPTGCVIS